MRSRLIGRGFLPSDTDRRTPYDVSLLLDSPESPIGLAMGFGIGGTGAAFTLQEATAPKWHEHLRIAGCEWLTEVAAKEREAKKLFSPQEILRFWSTAP